MGGVRGGVESASAITPAATSVEGWPPEGAPEGGAPVTEAKGVSSDEAVEGGARVDFFFDALSLLAASSRRRLFSAKGW
jgi:hypothetical protein